MGKGTGSPNRYRLTAGFGSRKDQIDCTKVDILAALIVPMDIWYLIPCLNLTGRALQLYPDNPKSRGQYEQFKERWGLFLT